MGFSEKDLKKTKFKSIVIDGKLTRTIFILYLTETLRTKNWNLVGSSVAILLVFSAKAFSAETHPICVFLLSCRFLLFPQKTCLWVRQLYLHSLLL